LKSSNSLYNELLNNSWLIINNGVFTHLNFIIDDLRLFLNIQTNLIELIENQNINKEIFELMKALILDYNIQYDLCKDELYNIEFNEKLFNILNENFGFKLFLKDNISNFNVSTLKEFYVLNDLEYLNYKNKERIIDINIFKHFNLFTDLMNYNFEVLDKESTLAKSLEYYRLNTLFKLFTKDFNDL
jgi:hypothetical protein